MKKEHHNAALNMVTSSTPPDDKMMRKEYAIAIINQSLVLSIRSNRHRRSYEH